LFFEGGFENFGLKITLAFEAANVKIPVGDILQ